MAGELGGGVDNKGSRKDEAITEYAVKGPAD